MTQGHARTATRRAMRARTPHMTHTHTHNRKRAAHWPLQRHDVEPLIDPSCATARLRRKRGRRGAEAAEALRRGARALGGGLTGHPAHAEQRQLASRRVIRRHSLGESHSSRSHSTARLHSSSAPKGRRAGWRRPFQGGEPTACCARPPALTTTPPVSLREESETRGKERRECL